MVWFLSRQNKIHRKSVWCLYEVIWCTSPCCTHEQTVSLCPRRIIAWNLYSRWHKKGKVIFWKEYALLWNNQYFNYCCANHRSWSITFFENPNMRSWDFSSHDWPFSQSAACLTERSCYVTLPRWQSGKQSGQTMILQIWQKMKIKIE